MTKNITSPPADPFENEFVTGSGGDVTVAVGKKGKFGIPHRIPAEREEELPPRDDRLSHVQGTLVRAARGWEGITLPRP